MRSKDIGFWVPPNDAHLWLDQCRYEKYVLLKKELARLEELNRLEVEDPGTEIYKVNIETSFDLPDQKPLISIRDQDPPVRRSRVMSEDTVATKSCELIDVS